MPFSRAQSGDKIPGFPGDQLPSSTLIIRYKGTFDYTYMFRTVQRWFEQRRFRFAEARVKDAGKKMKVDWVAKRDIDEFYREEYLIKMEMWDLVTQEVVVNGQPRKVLNGLAQFEVKGSIQVDRAGFFGKDSTGEEASPFAKWLGKIMADVRWREVEMKGIDVIEYRTMDIQTVIKECLNMTTKENAAW